MRQAWGVATAAAAALAASAAASAQDELVFPLNEAPAAALDAAMAAAPDVLFQTVDVEVEDGVVTLEFAGARDNGEVVEVDVAIAEDAQVTWNVLEVEVVIPFETVPEPVREALAIAISDFEPTSVERSERGETTVYEFEGVDADGLAIDIEVEATGDSVVVLDDEDT